MSAHSYTATGIDNAYLTVNDGTDDSDPACTIAVVYVPDAGFVTGSGWIDSPANLDDEYMQVGGKATFALVSKYKKGATLPEVNTESLFQAGGFNFHSSAYDWLVVEGKTKAQFKGSGTVNGALDQNGNPYRFLLWTGDGTPDTFRIKVWWEDDADGEHDVYNNGFEGYGYETGQPIGGGSIVCT